MAGTSKTRPHFDKSAGAVSIAECQITFAAADARVLLAKDVPAGALIIDAWFDIETAFDSGTSDELNIGWGIVGAATSDDILDAIDGQGSAGVYPTTRGVPRVQDTLAAEQDVYAYHLTGGTVPTAGSARAYIMYARTADNG